MKKGGLDQLVYCAVHDVFANSVSAKFYHWDCPKEAAPKQANPTTFHLAMSHETLVDIRMAKDDTGAYLVHPMFEGSTESTFVAELGAGLDTGGIRIRIDEALARGIIEVRDNATGSRTAPLARSLLHEPGAEHVGGTCERCAGEGRVYDEVYENEWTQCPYFNVALNLECREGLIYRPRTTVPTGDLSGLQGSESSPYDDPKYDRQGGA